MQLPTSICRIGRGGAGAGAGAGDLADEADKIEESIAFVNISVDQARDIVANDAGDASAGGASGESTQATEAAEVQEVQAPAGEGTAGVHSKTSEVQEVQAGPVQAPVGEATAGVHSKVKDAMKFMKSAPIEKLKQIKDTVSIDALKVKTSAISAKALVLNAILLFGSPSRPLTPLSVITLSLLGSSLGFHSYLWFATVGYTVSLGLISLVALICYNVLPSNTQIPKLSNLQTCMVLIWSIRLTAFLLYREYVAWPSLHAKTKRVDEESHDETKLGVWLTCGAFYAAQASPFCYRLQAAVDGVKSNWGLVGKFGIFAQFVGLLFESIADAQKATFKATEGNRNNWCNIGLWKHFSHPNYLGETIFWLGVYLGGIGCYTASYQYVISTIGFVFIACVLKSATDTLSAQELRRYGMNEDYLEFRRMRGFLGPIKLRRQPEKQILL